jgi:hypothetical protein
MTTLTRCDECYVRAPYSPDRRTLLGSLRRRTKSLDRATMKGASNHESRRRFPLDSYRHTTRAEGALRDSARHPGRRKGAIVRRARE